MKSGLEILRPALVAANVQAIGKIIIGTVKGDLHDIGKNLVAMMMEGAGFQVIDLGVDVPPDKFVAAVREHQPQLLGLSALLTTTMLAMRAKVKVLVGGAPVTDKFAREIGADAYAPDASTAATRAKAVLGYQGGA
jgi:5-methyltetrahydrofolate--homocysteine methyltransferase